jgi:plastocyanin
MKKMILRISIFISLVLVAAACTVNTSVNNPVVMTPTPTPVVTATPTATPGTGIGATISLGAGPTFSPSGVTIIHGQSVVWDGSLGVGSHNLTLDNFSGTTGSCAPTINTTSFPVTQLFPTVGTYYYHCGFHGGCGSGVCGVCSGGISNMIGFVQVN